MFSKKIAALVPLGSAAVIAGCAGGGMVRPNGAIVPNSQPAPVSTGVAATKANQARAILSLSVPQRVPARAARSGERALEYISSGTNYIRVTTTPSGGTQNVQSFGLPSAACPYNGSGMYTCNIGVPVGNDNFVVDLFDQTEPGVFSLLSTNSGSPANANITVAGPNSVNVSTLGVVATVWFEVPTPCALAGQLYGSYGYVNAHFLDADNNHITGAFANPVTVSVGGAGPAVQLVDKTTGATVTGAIASDPSVVYQNGTATRYGLRGDGGSEGTATISVSSPPYAATSSLSSFTVANHLAFMSNPGAGGLTEAAVTNTSVQSCGTVPLDRTLSGSNGGIVSGRGTRNVFFADGPLIVDFSYLFGGSNVAPGAIQVRGPAPLLKWQTYGIGLGTYSITDMGLSPTRNTVYATTQSGVSAAGYSGPPSSITFPRQNGTSPGPFGMGIVSNAYDYVVNPSTTSTSIGFLSPGQYGMTPSLTSRDFLTDTGGMYSPIPPAARAYSATGYFGGGAGVSNSLGFVPPNQRYAFFSVKDPSAVPGYIVGYDLTTGPPSSTAGVTTVGVPISTETGALAAAESLGYLFFVNATSTVYSKLATIASSSIVPFATVNGTVLRNVAVSTDGSIVAAGGGGTQVFFRSDGSVIGSVSAPSGARTVVIGP